MCAGVRGAGDAPAFTPTKRAAGRRIPDAGALGEGARSPRYVEDGCRRWTWKSAVDGGSGMLPRMRSAAFSATIITGA